MGVRASLTEISPDVFEQMVTGGEPKVSFDESHHIDKAWDEFDVVFKEKGPPLSLAISGDALHPQSPHTLREFRDGASDFFAAFASPRLVRQVADALNNVGESDYQRWEREVFGDNRRWGEIFLPDLKIAYSQAAEHGNALMIMIA